MVTWELKKLKFVTPGENPISKLSPLIQANVLMALRDGMLIAERTSIEKYLSGPYPSRLAVMSGLLRSRVRGMLGGTGGDPKVFATGILGVTSDVIYAWIHEFGGIITPKTKKALRFFWKRKGIWVITRKVTMPARPYLHPALEESIPEIERLIQYAIDNAYGES